MKVFLSHSSLDKAIVGRVYKELGAALCYYDIATFDSAGCIAEEIYTAMSNSTHFVLFASPNALGSGWVQGEMQRAFESWMQNGVRRALVFLLDGASVEDVPVWLRAYVMREPPSWRHIACRIQTEIDRAREHMDPPYFGADVDRLETLLLDVESAQLPSVIVVHGPDGSGRKRVINELYARQFTNVLRRKILVPLTEYSTELGLYREIIGLTRIATVTQFSEIFQHFEALAHQPRLDLLADEILKCTDANQCLILDCDSSLLTEDARLPVWLMELATILVGNDYPRITITTTRQPKEVSIAAMKALVVQEIHALERSKSQNLFNWWLKHLQLPYEATLKDVVFNACAGSPKQLELGAKLLAQAGKGQIERIKPHLLSTLEGLSKQVLNIIEEKFPHNVVLAFVANAGYLTRSDLLQYCADADVSTTKIITEAIDNCISYGFFIEDEVCLRMPEYLLRGGRSIGRSKFVTEILSRLWKLQAQQSQSLTLDDLTSIPVLNEYCLTFLRNGTTDGSIFDNILLASQCLRVARMMYDLKKYEESLRLCEMAFERRGTLTEDGIIEALRYMGLAAARRNNQAKFKDVLAHFNELGNIEKALRIRNFIEGFNSRLDGRFDNSLDSLKAAYKKGGSKDIHILRELAYMSIQIEEVPDARRYISSAMQRAGSNQYVLELAVRIELLAPPSTVASRAAEIEKLMERLREFDSSPDKIYYHQMCCEHQLALGDHKAANSILEDAPLNHSDSPAVKLLRARMLIMRKTFPAATAILKSLKEQINKRDSGQRKSILPIVIKLQIESLAATDLALGIDLFLNDYDKLPKKIARKFAEELLNNVGYTHLSLASTKKDNLKRISLAP